MTNETLAKAGVLRATLAVAGLVGVLVLVPLSGAAQRPPDLSGDWVLVSATYAGSVRGRGGAEMPKSAGGEHRTTSNAYSGAPFNCGRECTIVHKGQTLRIDRAYLASDPAPAPAVTLQLDGRQRSVVDSFSPRREIPATAQWIGDRLKIASSFDCFAGACTVTQLVSIQATQLVVVTSTSTDGNQPLTFRYKKK